MVSSDRWLWPIQVERRAPHGARQLVLYTLPERLLGPEPADCEVVLGDDYGARVLECVLRRESWWLWWTERALLARLEHRGRVSRSRRLPESTPELASAEASRADSPVWVTRGMFQAFGAALLPPASPTQAAVLDAGASLYSEVDPNFWIDVPPGIAWSPRALEDWCRAAAPSALSLTPFEQGAGRLCMIHDGDITFALPLQDAPAVLGSIEQWASTRGVTLGPSANTPTVSTPDCRDQSERPSRHGFARHPPPS